MIGARCVPGVEGKTLDEGCRSDCGEMKLFSSSHTKSYFIDGERIVLKGKPSFHITLTIALRQKGMGTSANHPLQRAYTQSSQKEFSTCERCGDLQGRAWCKLREWLQGGEGRMKEGLCMSFCAEQEAECKE